MTSEIIRIHFTDNTTQIILGTEIDLENTDKPTLVFTSTTAIKSIYWEYPRHQSNERSFFWLCHTLVARLEFTGTLTFHHIEDLHQKTWFYPRDRLGAIVSPIQIEEHYGVRLDGIHTGGIAERAGLGIGDILITWNGEQITEFHRPWKFFAGTYTTVHLQVLKNHALQNIEVVCNPPLDTEAIVERIRNTFGLTTISTGAFTKTAPTTSQQPLVSVLMHAYKAKWFEEALESVAQQTYTHMEIIVGDDSRDDKIYNIVQKYTDRLHIRYHKHSPPLQGWGSGNRYFCFAQAKGELIKFLCDDDILYPSCIEDMTRVLIEHPHVSLVTSYRECIDALGVSIPPITPCKRQIFIDSIFSGIGAVNTLLAVAGNAIGEPTTTMFRREDAADYIYYLDEASGVEPEAGQDDISLWVRLLCRGTLFYFAESKSAFRVMAEQGSQQTALVEDFEGKWTRTFDVQHRLGFHYLFDMQAHPLQSFPPTIDGENIQTFSGSQLLYWMQNTTKPNDQTIAVLKKTVQRLPSWSQLILYVRYWLTGSYFPVVQNLDDGPVFCARICTYLLTPVSFVHKYKQTCLSTYWFLLPSWNIPLKLLLRVQTPESENPSHCRIRINFGTWNTYPVQHRFCIVFLEKSDRASFLEIEAYSSIEQSIPIKSVFIHTFL